MKTNSPLLLLVEGDELLSDITAFRLELLGYTVVCVPSGEQAKARLLEEPRPTLLLVDTTLPDMNGFELVSQLSSSERTHKIPVMVLSVDADLTAVQRAHRAGAKDYLVLPYDPAVLEQKVQRLLRAVETTATVKA